ncbi:lipopolysaccharide biosynthesis protein [Pseudarthrobacter sp. S9]|uniref:lipopolysaccharide biosynthesis protein n=1 Tax=Pseudarthrobacter sp. S9 TaxID=3418421 RepID=UPI003D010702
MTERLMIQLKRPASILIMANFGSLGLGLISAALQARLLGPEGRGELATAMVPAGIAGMLLCLGLPDYFARQAAKGQALRPLALAAAALGLSVGAVVVVPYIWAAQLLVPAGTPAWYLLVTYAALTPVTTFGYCIVSLAVGAGWWKTVAIAKLAPQCLAVLGLAALSVPGASPGTVGALLIATSVVGLLLPLTRRAIWPMGQLTRSDLRTALSFGLRGWPAGAFALMNQRIDLLILTALASKEQLGYYAVATTLAAVLTAVSNSVAMPTRNRVSRGEQEVVPPITAATMAATLIVAGAVILVLPALVNFVLGPSFLPAMPVMIILLAAQVPMAGIVIMTQSLIGVGKPSLPFYGEIFALVTTASIVVILVPQFGITAAAWANLSGNVISFCTLIFLSQRYVSRRPPWRYLFIRPRHLALIMKGSQ